MYIELIMLFVGLVLGGLLGTCSMLIILFNYQLKKIVSVKSLALTNS